MNRRIQKLACMMAFLFLTLMLLPAPSDALEGQSAYEGSLQFDLTSSRNTSQLPEDAELLFSVYDYGTLLVSDSSQSIKSCAAKALSNVRAYRVSRNGQSYIDLYVGLSAPFGTCVRIKGVTDGMCQADDITDGSYFGKAFKGQQTVPSTAFHLYVEGTIPIKSGHSYDVSWHFKSWLYNGVNSYYSGSQELWV